MGKKIVLLYHRVNNTENDYNRITIEEENFYAHMSYLKMNYKIITLEEMIAYKGSEDVVSVTFDDGFADFYEKAFPILTQFQIPVTIFVTTGMLDTTEELWTTEIIRILFSNRAGNKEIQIKICGRNLIVPVFTIEQRAEAYAVLRNILMQLSNGERNKIMRCLREQLGMAEKGRKEYRLMSVSECRKIAESPLVTIGAHTVNHCSLGRVDESEIRYEILESIRRLETILKKKIKYFAYPFGGQADYSKRVSDILRCNGIEAACVVKAAVYDKDSIYEIPRFYVGNWTVEQFREKLSEWISGQKLSEQFSSQHTYIGKIEHDIELWSSDREIVIWGSGIRGKKIYELLCKCGQSGRIVAFCDNNSELWGKRIDQIPIWNIDQTRQRRNIDIIIHNTYDLEIVRQLEGIEYEHIHWLI